MKTELPDSVFPKQLAAPNRISTRYITTTLFPQPGPQTAASIIKTITEFSEEILDVHAELSAFLAGAETNETKKRWHDLFERLGPVLRETTQTDEISEKWRLALSDLDAYVADEATKAPSPRVAGQPNRPARPRPGRSPAAGLVWTNPSIALAASPYKVTEGGLIAVTMARMTDSTLEAVKGISKKAAANQPVSEEEWQAAIKEQEALFSKHRIVDFLVRGGWLVRALIRARLLGLPENFISPRIFSGNSLHLTELLDAVSKQLAPIPTAELVQRSVSVVQRVLTQRYKHFDPAHPARQIAGDSAALKAFSTGVYHRSRALWKWLPKDSVELPNLDDFLTVESQREWAFLRHERLDLNLGEPRLRGPVNADSLPPLSTLTLKDETSTVAEQVSTLYQATVTVEQRQTNLVDARTLEGLVEQSSYTEDDYGDTETMFRTLTEQRRSRIDALLEEASNRNDRLVGERTSSTKTTQRKYHSQGQDPDNAVTELSFQVVTPVNAEVYLEDVDLAWCPRIEKPFADLQKQVLRVEDDAEREYRDENQLPQPAISAQLEYEQKSIEVPTDVAIQDRNSLRSQSWIEVTYVRPEELNGFELVAADCHCHLDIVCFWIEGFLGGSAERKDIYPDQTVRVSEAEKPTIRAKVFFDADQIWSIVCSLAPDKTIWVAKVTFRVTIALRIPTEESKKMLAQDQALHWDWYQSEVAMEGRAKQYARMRRNETIALFSDGERQKDLAFTQLTGDLFPEGSWSYFREVLKTCIEGLEAVRTYRATTPCEPQLGKRGLYPTLSVRGSSAPTRTMMDLLAYCDGRRDLLEVAEVIGKPIVQCAEVAALLLQHGLLTTD